MLIKKVKGRLLHIVWKFGVCVFVLLCRSGKFWENLAVRCRKLENKCREPAFATPRFVFMFNLACNQTHQIWHVSRSHGGRTFLSSSLQHHMQWILSWFNILVIFTWGLEDICLCKTPVSAKMLPKSSSATKVYRIKNDCVKITQCQASLSHLELSLAIEIIEDIVVVGHPHWLFSFLEMSPVWLKPYRNCWQWSVFLKQALILWNETYVTMHSVLNTEISS